MWWFTIVLFVNFVIPTRVLYDQLGMNVGGVRSTLLDWLVFLAPLMTLLPAWQARLAPVTRSHPAFRVALVLFALAFVSGAMLGALNLEADFLLKWYLQCARNLVLVPVAMYVAYQALGSPRQLKFAVYVLFLASVASAAAMVVSGGEKSDEIAASSTVKFDALRETRDQASGDFGLMAASAVIYSWIAQIRFVPAIVSLAALALATVGTLLLSHRSAWLMHAVVWMFAGTRIQPSNWGRKILFGATTVASVLLFAVLGIVLVESVTGRANYSEWVGKRLQSLLPGEEDSGRASKAWDTRIPAMVYDLKLWAGNPLLGRGFAIHEAYALRTGEYHSFRHTPWTSTLAETGLPGFAAFSVVIVSLVVVGVRLARQGPDHWARLLGAMLASYGLSMYLVGWMSLSWNGPRQAVNLALLSGLLFRCRDLCVAEAQHAWGLEQLPLHEEMGWQPS